MYIEELSNLAGVSGNETEVRRFIRDSLPRRNIEAQTDSMGNLIVHKKGRSSSRMPHVMVAAHMDEVGLMISSIEKSGHLRVLKVGAIDDRVLVSKQVVIGKDKIPGIIGAKAVHLQKPEERKKNFKVDQLFIDIGAKGKEEAEKLVKIGDYASFGSRFTSIGEGSYMGKAFDDRAGCSVLLELLKEKNMPTFTAVFTVQEEVGLRGARVAAYTVKPDAALVLEGTSAADVPESKDHEHVTSLGKGPALSVMDQSVIVDRDLLDKLIKLAETNKIPFQFRRFTGGATDAGAISLSRGGVKSAVMSVPCRYIHSPFSVMKESDYKHTLNLAVQFIRSFAG